MLPRNLRSNYSGSAARGFISAQPRAVSTLQTADTAAHRALPAGKLSSTSRPSHPLLAESSSANEFFMYHPNLTKIPVPVANKMQCNVGMGLYLNSWSRYLRLIAGGTLRIISLDSGLCSVHSRYKHCPLYSVWWCLHISRLYLDLSLEVAHYRPSHYNVIPM